MHPFESHNYSYQSPDRREGQGLGGGIDISQSGQKGRINIADLEKRVQDYIFEGIIHREGRNK